MEASTSEKSLPDLFNSAKAKQDSLDEHENRSATFQDILQIAIQELQQCSQLLEQLSLFSINEELEDVSTRNLQYLTVPYLLSELLLRSYDDRRLTSLGRASQLLEDFLTRLDHYRMLSKSDQGLFERFIQQRKSFSVISSSSPDEKRRIKIARFQEEKALRQKLQVCRSILKVLVL